MIEETLKESLSRINKRHFNVENPNTRVVKEKVLKLEYSKKNTEPENNFVNYIVAYYLVTLDTKNLKENDNLTIFPQIQLYKQLVNKSEYEKLIKDFDINNGLYPDIVFHKQQDDNDPDNQKIAIECKINKKLTYDDFSKDLAKLLIYILGINFQKSIFIIANNDKSLIQKYLKCFKLKYNSFNNALSKVELWIKNYDQELEIIKCNQSTTLKT